MSRPDGPMYYENPRYLWAMFKLCALRGNDALARYYAQEAEMIEKLGPDCKGSNPEQMDPMKIRAQRSKNFE